MENRLEPYYGKTIRTRRYLSNHYVGGYPQYKSEIYIDGKITEMDSYKTENDIRDYGLFTEQLKKVANWYTNSYEWDATFTIVKDIAKLMYNKK